MCKVRSTVRQQRDLLGYKSRSFKPAGGEKCSSADGTMILQEPSTDTTRKRYRFYRSVSILRRINQASWARSRLNTFHSDERITAAHSRADTLSSSMNKDAQSYWAKILHTTVQRHGILTERNENSVLSIRRLRLKEHEQSEDDICLAFDVCICKENVYNPDRNNQRQAAHSAEQPT